MIEIKEGRYFIAFWSVSDGVTGDWLCAVWRDQGKPFEGVYRFRYYKDQRVFDSADVKHWYQVHPPEGLPESEVERAIDFTAQAVRASYRMAPVIYKIPLHTDDPERILSEIGKFEFMHMN